LGEKIRRGGGEVRKGKKNALSKCIGGREKSGSRKKKVPETNVWAKKIRSEAKKKLN